MIQLINALSSKYIFAFVLLFLHFQVYAQQQSTIDSLELLLKKTRADTTKVRLMNDLAYEYYSSNPKRTIALTESSVKISYRLKSYKDYLYGLYVLGIGKSIVEGNEEAQKTAYLLIREASRLRFDFYKAQGHFLLAYTLRTESKDKESLQNFKIALSLFKKEESLPNLANTYNQLAFTYSKMSSYNIAIKYYLLALKIFKQVKQIEGYKTTLNNLGETYAQIYAYDLALKQFRESAEIGKKINNQIWIASDYLSIASVLIATKKFDEAEKYVLKGLELFKSIPYEQGIANSYNDLGKIYFEKKQTKKAISCFKSALEIDKKNKNQYHMIETYSNLGNTYQSLKQIDYAKLYYLKAKNISEKYNLAEQKRDVYKLLADLYAQSGNYKEGYFFSQKHQKIKDSIFDEIKNNQLITLQIEYDTEQKETENKLLKQRNKIQNLAIEKQLQSKKIILLILFSLIGISIVLYWLFRSKKIANKNLQDSKDVIDNKNVMLESTQQKLELSLHEKEILLKEIHHRVKNNLQLVNSLLSIQARGGNKKTNESDFLYKSQIRIQSMALIHETLYQSENLSTVDFKKYLLKLTKHLLVSFDSDKKNVKININTNNIIIDIETVIPLGLIITELVNNSLKHAFAEKEGEINIDLQKKTGNSLELIIRDNGQGISDLAFENQDTLGMQLVKDLVTQIGGQLALENLNGAKFTITFPSENL